MDRMNLTLTREDTEDLLRACDALAAQGTSGDRQARVLRLWSRLHHRYTLRWGPPPAATDTPQPCQYTAG